MSQLYHRVLQHMASALLERGQDWSELPAETAQRMIGLFAGNVARDVRGELLLSLRPQQVPALADRADAGASGPFPR